MSDIDSPVLRLIPYLAAFTVTIFVTLPLFANGSLLTALLVAALAYFGTYFLTRFVIGLIVRSSRGEDRE